MWLSLLVIIVQAHGLVAQQDETIYDSDINVISFEKMRYPPLAEQARIQGTVVVRLTLDGAGKVTSTAAVSGAKLLVPDSLSNAKKWKFRSNPSNAAVIIYEFRLVERVCNDSERKHLFVFRKPNVVSVIGCAEIWQP